jgi:hypothetical protein
MNARRLGISLLALAALAGCGGGGEGRVNVRLVDGPGDYQEINLHVLRVELHGTGGWRTLGSPDVTVDLLSLRNGVVATLVDGATVPAGTYTQLRLVLGEGSTVRLADGTLHDLVVPSGQRSGAKLLARFTVEPDTTRDVFVDFDGAHSIMLHRTGASEKYVLRPVIHAFDRLATGAISGRLTDAQTGAGLADVGVTAQELDGNGEATLVRSARTGADGSYLLDLLPLGGTYFVVSQPVLGEASYAARSSAGVPVTEAAPAPTVDLSFPLAAAVGGVAGKITPAAEADGDLVLARANLDAGGTSRSLIVRTAVPAVVSGVETYAMELLPAGGYVLEVVRRTVDAAGDETLSRSAPVNVTVTAGATAAADLAL